jgi:hypothetical protein
MCPFHLGVDFHFSGKRSTQDSNPILQSTVMWAEASPADATTKRQIRNEIVDWVSEVPFDCLIIT